MLYLHKTYCISAQDPKSLETLVPSENNILKAIEPSYAEIPRNLLRRMGKASKLSIGAALPLLSGAPRPDGIILGTAHGGMEDCIRFMEQIVSYNETDLAPANFVQSTPNGLAAQIGLMQQNKGYNITHSHRGLSFENALLDAMMRLTEYPDHCYLLGGTDEISSYNYNVDFLDGWFKKEIVSNTGLYESTSDSSLAGEGSAMFLVSSDKRSALACVKALHFFHTDKVGDIEQELKDFLRRSLPSGEEIGIFLSGENGDARYKAYYTACEKILNTTTLRYKHMSGEYATASAQALWLACELLQKQEFPQHMIKTNTGSKSGNILLYNSYRKTQHSFILLGPAV